MLERLSVYEVLIIRLGIFLIFLFTFGDYVFAKLWPIVSQLLQ